MSVSRVVAKNTSFLIGADVASKLVAVFFASVLARRLGAAAFGEFTLAQVLGGIVIALADPGISQIVYRDIATAKDPGVLVGAGAFLRLAFLPVAFGIMMLVASILGYSSGLLNVVAVVGLATLIFGFAELYFYVFKALKRASLVFWGRGFRSLLLLALAVFLLRVRVGVGQAAWAYLGYAILGTSLISVLVGRTGYHHKLPSLTFSFGVLRRGLPLALQALMIYTYLYADTVMLSVMRTMNEVGHYQAAYRLVTSLNIVGTALVASVFPFFVQRNASGGQGLSEFFYRAVKYLMAVGIGIAVGTTMLAGRIIVLFYGNGFSPSTRFLQILIWSEALIFLGYVCVGLLLALDRRWELFWQAGLAAIVNLSLNFPAIHYWGALGASVTTVATETFALGFLLWRVERAKITLGSRWIPDLGRIIAACACMSLILLIAARLPLIPVIVLGGCAYFGALVLIRFFDEKDVRLGRQLLGSTGV